MRQVCAHWAWVEESHLDVCMVSISSGEMYLRPMVLNRMSKICGEWAPKLDHSFVIIINRLHVRSIHSVSDVTVYSRAVALPIPSLWWNLFNFSLKKKKKKIKMKKKTKCDRWTNSIHNVMEQKLMAFWIWMMWQALPKCLCMNAYTDTRTDARTP